MVESWWAPGRVIASLRGLPDRALLVILMAAMLLYLVAQAPGHARAAHLDPSVPMGARMAGAAMAALFIMPLLAYGLAALVAGLSRLTRWHLSGRDSRLALFWALLAAAPAMLLAGLTAGLVGPGAALTLVRAVAGFGYLMIWVAGLRRLAAPSAD